MIAALPRPPPSASLIVSARLAATSATFVRGTQEAIRTKPWE